MGIPLVRGRDFDDRDRIGAPHVAILNQAAARMFFGDEDPLGKRLTVSWNDAREVEIIGVTADIRHGQLQSRADPGLFALLALTLTSVGLYGVLAYSVTQRTREIGVRVALGASFGAAFRLVLRDGLRLTAAGLAIGLGAALVLTRFMRGLLYDVEPLDPAAFAWVTALLTSVAVACSIPAARATRVDPAMVLRDE